MKFLSLPSINKRLKQFKLMQFLLVNFNTYFIMVVINDKDQLLKNIAEGK